MTNAIVEIAGISLKKIGDLTPEESIWVNENAIAQQREQAQKKYALVQEIAEMLSTGDYEALIILNTPPALRTIEQSSAIELLEMRKAASTEAMPPTKNPDLEYLTYMLNSRRVSEEAYSYEDVEALDAETKQQLFDFLAVELGMVTEDQDDADPTGKNLIDSEQVSSPPETSEPTG